MSDKLDRSELERGLQDLDGWTYAEPAGAIERVFRFKNFSQAFAFMTRVALAAEKMDHHPDWSNSYATVTIRLSTHDAGGVTHKDLELAKSIDLLLS